MKIRVVDGIVSVNLPEKTPEKIEQYLVELKTSLDVSWIELCEVFGLAKTQGNSKNLMNWRNGKKDMPDSHWFLLLSILGRMSAIQVEKVSTTSGIKNEQDKKDIN